MFDIPMKYRIKENVKIALFFTLIHFAFAVVCDTLVTPESISVETLRC